MLGYSRKQRSKSKFSTVLDVFARIVHGFLPFPNLWPIFILLMLLIVNNGNILTNGIHEAQCLKQKCKEL